MLTNLLSTNVNACQHKRTQEEETTKSKSTKIWISTIYDKNTVSQDNFFTSGIAKGNACAKSLVIALSTKFTVACKRSSDIPVCKQITEKEK